jgi:hypothetical protein
MRNALIIVNLLFFTILSYLVIRPSQYHIPLQTLPKQASPVQPTPELPKEPPTEQKTEPKWEIYKPIQSPDKSLGKVLSDIESHMPAHNIYKDNDPITSSHEQCHGLNSNLRQKFGRDVMEVMLDDYLPEVKVFKCINDGERINAFYCLEDRAAIIIEPRIMISDVVKLLPPSLHGDVYNLYLVQQAASWGDTPLYIFDEWTAYTSGSACRADLGIQSRAETVQYMMEFDVYAVALAMAVKQKDTTYDDQQFKAFLMWNVERSMSIYRGEEGAANYLQKFRNSSDAEALRDFGRKYFGAEWCKKVFGI